MPHQAPSDQVEDVAVDQRSTGILWEWDSDGSRFVHSNFVICVPPKIKTHFVTTFPTSKGEVLITVSPSTNISALLVSFCKELVDQPPTTYHELFLPHSCCRQWDIFHPSAVDVCQLIHHQDGYLPNNISPKWCGQRWYWYIVEVRFETRIKFSHISCNLLLYTHNFFNFIARVWFNFFAHVWFNYFARVWCVFVLPYSSTYIVSN